MIRGLCLLLLLVPLVSCWGYRCTSNVVKISSRYMVKQELEANSEEASSGVKILQDYLNNKKSILKKMVLLNEKLRKEIENANFWTGGSFLVEDTICNGIIENGFNIDAKCRIRGKEEVKQVFVPFHAKVRNEKELKDVVIEMLHMIDRSNETASLVTLPFGDDYNLPLDFRWNEVPHATWVRNYVYEQATCAVLKALSSSNNKFQMKVNFPEVNPAFDTYRIGTILEMIRHIVLVLTCDEGKRVRICVQQSLGEGVFAGMPLALSSMRFVLEKMDFGSRLSPEQKANVNDNKNRRNEALVRFGAIGKDQVAPDDDIVIVIAPQNLVGGSLIPLLDEMIKELNGRPIILFNPLLNDRPSSNGLMNVRGRSERIEFQKSFMDIFTMRLLYPSSGGYMFPIRGMVVNKDLDSAWCVYSKSVVDGKEKYDIIGAFPKGPEPSPEKISAMFV